MKYLPLLWANLRRKPARLSFTLLSVLVAFLLFGILSATREAFVGGVDLIGDNRLITIHRVSLVQPLPEAYGNRIARVDGVEDVGFASWMEGYYQEPRNFVALIAVDERYLGMYEEILIAEEHKQNWLRNRTGVIIGKTLAERHDWSVGDRIPLQSGIYTKKDGGNTFEVTVEGVYDSSSRAFDTASAFIHHEYLDEARAFGSGTVGWYILSIADPERAPEIAEAVDRLFQNSPAETKTSTEQAFMQGFTSQIGNIGTIVMGIVTAVFFSMLLVTGNTMAQSVRERTNELAVLKALGFTDRGVLALVLTESVLVTVMGGLAGLTLAYFIAASLAAGPLAQYFPGFYLTGSQFLIGLIAAAGLGLLAGLWPGIQALRLRVATALRRA